MFLTSLIRLYLLLKWFLVCITLPLNVRLVNSYRERDGEDGGCDEFTVQEADE